MGGSSWRNGESALLYWRNPEWPENFEWNAESRVDGGSGNGRNLKRNPEPKTLYGILLSTFFNLETENIRNSK